MSQLGKMIALVATKFENRMDKSGKAYFLHCMRVMNQMSQSDEELMCIALGHDLVEDCPELNQKVLYEMGFSMRIVETILVLTHDKGVDYMDYIKKISHFPDAVTVKLADLRDNSDITRLKGLTKKDHDRIEKYHLAYTYLSKL